MAAFDDLIPGGRQAATGGLFDDLIPTKPKSRNIAAVANDTVIEAANAVAGGVKSAADFVRPGNALSSFIDENIIKPGEASQSTVVKGEKARYASEMEAADGIGSEIGATLGYVGRNPLIAAAQAAGSFALPGAAVKGGGMLASLGGAGAKGLATGGLAGGAVAGAALSGGDAAGTAYELVKRAGGSEDEAVEAARKASVLPAAIGAAGGVIGAERLLAGAGGFKGGMLGRALKTAGVEGAQEAVEEGVTQYEGQRAAVPFDPSIDPMKGVAGAATMGGVLGAATGGGVSLLSGEHGNKPAADPAASVPTLAIGNTPDPYISFPDGTVGKRADVDRYVSSLPEDQRVAARAKLLGLKPQKADPVSSILSSDGVDSAINAAQRAVGYNVPRIPIGEASDLVPDETINADVAFMKFRSPQQIAEDGMPQIPTGEAVEIERRAMDRGIPAGDATEMIPAGEATEVPDIPVGELSYIEPEAGMAPRSPRSDAVDIDPAAPNAVAGYIKRMVDINTPAARAFVQDYRAGRITDADVMGLLVPDKRAEPTPDERIAAAAAQAPRAERQPGDILTADGMPYGSKTAANVRAVKEGLTPASVIEIPGAGWVVRPKESPLEPVLPANARVADRPADGGGDQPGGGGGTVGRVADDGRARPMDAGLPAIAAGGNADQAAGSGGGNAGTALSDGQRITLQGKAWTVIESTPTVVKLDDGAGTRRVVQRGSKTWGQIEVTQAETSRPAEAGQGAPDAAQVAQPAGGAILTDALKQNAGPTNTQDDAQPTTSTPRTQAPASPADTSVAGVPAATSGAVEADGLKPEGFDSEAWDKERSDRIKASRDAGNTHLDTVPAYVEAMRGKPVRYVHDPKVKGAIRTVDTNGNVYVNWSDDYSAQKEMARPVLEGKRTVMQSSLGPRDLKDYVLDQPVPNATAPVAPAGKTIQSGTEPSNRSEGKTTRTDGRDVAEPVPTFEDYESAQAWIESTAKEYGGKQRFTASRVYGAVYGQIKPLYDAAKATDNAARMAALADAGLKIGDRVEMRSVGMFLNASLDTGTLVDRGGAPFVKIDGEMTFSKNGRLSTIKSIAWDSRWKAAATNAGAPVEAASGSAAPAPASPAPADEDPFAALFGTPAEQEAAQARFVADQAARNEGATQAAKQQRADAERIRGAITAEKQRATNERDEWAAKVYKKNQTQVDLPGDGPSNQGSMSIGAINESKRRNAVEALTQEIGALDKLGRGIATDEGAVQFIKSMRDLMGKAERAVESGNWPGQTADEMFQSMMLDDLKFRGPGGRGNVTSNGLSRAVLGAIKPQAAPASQPKPPKVYKTKAAAQIASKLSGNTQRVKKIEGGFILRDATDKELAAAEKAGKRLSARKAVDAGNDPLLTAIAKLGGLAMNEKADTIGEGNKNTGSGFVFTNAGLAIDIMAGDLSELNYIPADEVTRDDGVTWLRDAVKAEYMGARTHYSERNESWLEDAQREAEDRYNSEPLDDLTLSDLDDAGYTGAPAEVQAATEQMLAEAQELGIDTDTLREDADSETRGQTDDEFQAYLQAKIRQAIAQARGNAGRADAGPARTGDQGDGQSAGGQGQEQGSEGLKRPPVAEGNRIRFTGKDGAVFEGMAVQVMDTSGGNYRIKIRTDEPAPQGGGNISRTVYSQDGTFEPADAPLLTAQTSEDLKAKAEREGAAEKAERAKKAVEQARLRKEAEDRDNRARADAIVGDFQLGQDADQQMSGMGDMFADAPAEPAGPTSNYKAGDRITADVDVLEGDVVRYDGATWMAKVKRGVTIPLHPIASGKPQINADSLVRVNLNDNEVTHTGMNVYGYGGQTEFGKSTDVPQGVSSRLKIALDKLRRVDEELAGVQRARGNGQILASALRDSQEEIRKAMGTLETVRGLAANNGVDVDALIEKMGGLPDLSKYGQPAAVPVTPQIVPAAKAEDEPASFTEAQARQQFEWRDPGQKDGVKTHMLFWYEKPEDKGTGRAMGRLQLTRYEGSSGWQIDSEGEKYPGLADAKKAAIEVGVRMTREQGWIKPAEPAAAPKPAPKSFRKSVKVTTAVFMEETGAFADQEVDAETALKALDADIAELDAFRKCIAGG